MWWSCADETGNIPVTPIYHQNFTKTVRSTFGLIPHAGATSFITWIWSNVVRGWREKESGWRSLGVLGGVISVQGSASVDFRGNVALGVHA